MSSQNKTAGFLSNKKTRPDGLKTEVWATHMDSDKNLINWLQHVNQDFGVIVFLMCR